MIRKILVANRGEIAVRIVRACRELDIATVAVHSEADQDALHVRLADEDVCIGPPSAQESYLNVPRILSAAEITDCDAIHPGYGFLAENARFAEICASCGLTFIGPSPEVMRALGDKALARETMAAAGVPVLPGSDGVLPDVEAALRAADEIGLPIILKASAGGGGRGMRRVYERDQVESAFVSASTESQAAFGNGDMYAEKLAVDPRHVEVQILGDTHGNVVHLYERECSIQRRHQKLIEEGPSPAVSEETRQRLCQAAADGGRKVGYAGAGTVEFLVDAEGGFYFMEMNARIQVEHPVTELITGRDLIKESILVAGGEPLSFTQDEVRVEGHAIECRVNAEDPARDFTPCPGHVEHLHLPGGPGIRVDTHMDSGADIPPYYDSLVAKVLAHGRDRAEAIARMKRALDEFSLEGVKTTVPLLAEILEEDAFVQGCYDTGFLDRRQSAE
ncbi:MAG: acetyl-CoA carboxylase biotin carboxylase subunit [Gemmatimonadota bacterium]|jgi:acetyl-CoA carboxylase biotin carboxylase subunit|nr:acetyl-CoA carboxylase biotin carboxylase subunit [Candidatus Woesearchaeota archaeon]MDP6530175.1 acetyl-CoA carboxylase biotin carboxylase subunit [Gemmatimonadota bacterium]MDP6802068.1 acetyl-CoA carboxylase biotin carboxylase subunit [Gemmatimonadota bacterium]MDP7032448.1 acetyl-CoA carboxylase biotin carboxylase subunit [Gemmatimonadota bacterium]